MKSWDGLTRDDFIRLIAVEDLRDSEIAERFGVTEGRVAYKRKKFGLIGGANGRLALKCRLIIDDTEDLQLRNDYAKRLVLSENYTKTLISKLALQVKCGESTEEEIHRINKILSLIAEGNYIGAVNLNIL